MLGINLPHIGQIGNRARVGMGVKAQVVAQYGADFDQVQALGLKKKSERKTPGRKAKPSV